MTKHTLKAPEAKRLSYTSRALKAEHFAVVDSVVAEPGPGQILAEREQ